MRQIERYNIAFTQSFWRAMLKLDRTMQRETFQAVQKAQQGHASVRLHALKNLPFVSFGINKNAYRIICKQEGDLLLMCHVAPHDPAYAWARSHRVQQFGRHIRIMRTQVVEAPEAPPEPVVEPEATPRGMLHGVEDDVFQTFGIGAHAAGVLRHCGEDPLAELIEHYPVPLAEALLSLAVDPEDLPAIESAFLEALQAEEDGKAVPAPTLGEAVADPINSGTVWNAGSDEAAVSATFDRALKGDFAAWRIFLHPSQRRVVQAKAKGAVKVTGGPGTGKTVVALHRAVVLAERYEQPVLLTTFNTTLARQLASALDSLLAGRDDIRARIDVKGLTQVTRDILRRAGRPAELISDDAECWNTALALDKAGRGKRFYKSEREHVVARLGTWTAAAYFKARRSGRSQRLDRRARREVHQVLTAYEQALSAQGGSDSVGLARDATRALLEGAAESPYRAVVCDEIQDVGASELRFLAALARSAQTGALHSDGLTLCGDGHQRLYNVPIALKDCGIETRGRASRRLRLNYRTTEAIRRKAVSVISGVALDPFDEGTGDPLDGYRSLRPGVPTESRVFGSFEEEVAWIRERAATPGFDAPLLVLAATNDYRDKLKAALEARGETPRTLKSKDLPEPQDTLLLCTMHRAKGLEAPSVIVAGSHLLPLRYQGSADPADRRLWDKKQRSLLYVAVTRARDWCGISSIGERDAAQEAP